MALPTASNLATLDYAYLGAPFCEVPAKSSIDTTTMDWAYLGAPFVCNSFGGATSIFASLFLWVLDEEESND